MGGFSGTKCRQNVNYGGMIIVFMLITGTSKPPPKQLVTLLKPGKVQGNNLRDLTSKKIKIPQKTHPKSG
ncbi:hypothetical protein EG028_26495 [Chitinophaga barathri]|uniref:Uncharacterized protein n=1 Tax=Chitinophaga barathri TaxID=1647451 RepID=A0A3N4M4Z1_9BACT|nr:hypothetical protein EG028_26495 [Chitinophaga barathri]